MRMAYNAKTLTFDTCLRAPEATKLLVPAYWGAGGSNACTPLGISGKWVSVVRVLHGEVDAHCVTADQQSTAMQEYRARYIYYIIMLQCCRAGCWRFQCCGHHQPQQVARYLVHSPSVVCCPHSEHIITWLGRLLKQP